MKACLDVAMNYADRRKAFGRPIRKFQAVSFMIAKAQTLLDAEGRSNDMSIKRQQLDMQPMRTLGEHVVRVRLTMDLIPELKVTVYREGEAEPEGRDQPDELAAVLERLRTIPGVTAVGDDSAAEAPPARAVNVTVTPLSGLPPTSAAFRAKAGRRISSSPPASTWSATACPRVASTRLPRTSARESSRTTTCSRSRRPCAAPACGR